MIHVVMELKWQLIFIAAMTLLVLRLVHVAEWNEARIESEDADA